MAQAVQLAAHGAGGVNRALGQAFRRCICGGQAAHPGTGEAASAAGAGGIIAGSAAGQLTLHDLTEVRRPAAGGLTSSNREAARLSRSIGCVTQRE
jgi:hypothetical protein